MDASRFLRCLLLVLLFSAHSGCNEEPAIVPVTRVETAPPRRDVTRMPMKMSRFCGDCHSVPSPSTFPRSSWYAEVKRGFDFYTEAGRSDLDVPPMREVVAWYQSQAPDHLTPTDRLASGTPNVFFREIQLPLLSRNTPMVSGLNWSPGADSTSSQLRITDMSSGQVCEIQVVKDVAVANILLMAGNPACSKTVDLDSDGVPDLLVADLGSEAPGDHDKGRLLFLPGKKIAGTPEPVVLLDDVSRIADVDWGDFDSDGDLDLVVAEFGWLKTGSIVLLENTAAEQGSLRASDFKSHLLDRRHGTIHVPVGDINGDGVPDFAALISQEHETIEAFLGNGDLTFRREVILSAEDPAFGSSGIELVDIDDDKDLDIVYSNGDTLDGLLVKNYHGVHLLSNEGTFPFERTKLLSLAGASDTATADIDGDGDLDIAVAGFLPPQLHAQLDDGQFDSMCWLEQTASMQFVVHPLERSNVGHLSIAAGDFNGDDRVDIAVGNYPGKNSGAIWLNLGPGSK